MSIQTVTYTIAAAADDATVSVTDGTNALQFTQGLFAGRFNTAAYFGHMRFAGVNLMQGAAIKSAVLEVGLSQKAATAGTYGSVKGIAADNVASIPNSQANANLPNYRASLTAASTPIGNPSVGTVTFDVLAQVLEIVNRPGWVSGNGLGLMFDSAGATQWALFNAFEDGATPAKLTITYENTITLGQRLRAFAAWVGREIKRLDARIDGVGSGGSGATVAHLGYQPNRYYGGLRGGIDATNILVEANKAYATPMLLDRATPIRGLVIGVDTAVTGGNCLVGIYTAVDGAPGALLHQVAAPISVAATGFITGLLPAVVTLPAGGYFIVTLFDTAPRVRGYTASNGMVSQILGHPSAFNIFNTGSYTSGYERSASTPYSSGLPSVFGAFGYRTGQGTPAAGFLTPPA